MIRRQEIIEIVRNTKRAKLYCFFLIESPVDFGPQINNFCRDIETKNTPDLDDDELVRFVHIIQIENDPSRKAPYSAKIDAVYRLENLLGQNTGLALQDLYRNKKYNEFNYENILAIIRHPDPLALVTAFKQLRIRINVGKGLPGNHDIELPTHSAILEEMRIHPQPKKFIESKTKEIYDFYTEQSESAKYSRLQ